MRLSDYGKLIYGAQCLDSIFSFRQCYCEHFLSFSPGEGGHNSTYPALLKISSSESVLSARYYSTNYTEFTYTTGKSTQSLILPGWVKVTHENLFCIETKPNCIVKSLSCFYCNLHPNASKCPLGTKKSCWEQLRTASVKSSSNQEKWSFASTFMFDKRLGFTLALIQQQETIIWWQRSPPLTLSLK